MNREFLLEGGQNGDTERFTFRLRNDPEEGRLRLLCRDEHGVDQIIAVVSTSGTMHLVFNKFFTEAETEE